ncbi:hypothetical protein [Agromyces sp. CCNWLW203]|uniref:hypothetical protein n=1 Tax=Agromyces sp. CCNWLW203 TaxID=3112842 RepID=UPI002F964D30
MTDSTVSGQPYEPTKATGPRRPDDELRADETGAEEPRKDDGETKDPTQTPDGEAAPLSESTDGGLDGGDPGVEE